MPKDEPQQNQKLRRPATGPNKGAPSGLWEMAPLTMRLMPAASTAGIRSIARPSQGISLSRSSWNSSLSDCQAGNPSGGQASTWPDFS